MQNRIGDLNGKWAILFRATLAAGVIVMPSIIALLVWLVASVQDTRVQLSGLEAQQIAHLSNRYTVQDAREDQFVYAAQLQAMRNDLMAAIREIEKRLAERR